MTKTGAWTLIIFVFFLGLTYFWLRILGFPYNAESPSDWYAGAANFIAFLGISALSFLISFGIWIVGILIMVFYAHFVKSNSLQQADDKNNEVTHDLNSKKLAKDLTQQPSQLPSQLRNYKDYIEFVIIAICLVLFALLIISGALRLMVILLWYTLMKILSFEP